VEEPKSGRDSFTAMSGRRQLPIRQEILKNCATLLELPNVLRDGISQYGAAGKKLEHMFPIGKSNCESQIRRHPHPR